MPMLLALDTSTRLAGIALYDDENGLVAERTWLSANQHTVELMPQVNEVLAQARVKVGTLAAVGVALGPGSFTGLRVALAAAKGLALANGLQLFGVPTLDAVAYPHGGQALPVIALVQAGRGRVCWARYDPGPPGCSAKSPYMLSTIDALVATVSQPMLFAGEMLPSTRSALTEALGNMARCLPPALATRRAGCLAEIAWRRFVAGDADDLTALSPIYLHEPAPPGRLGPREGKL